MNSVLQRIEIRNFKAFRDFALDLNGRHLLVYGANGSGKSSLYWALYTFLQSGRRSAADVSKYFDPSNTQNLLNLHEQAIENPASGEIALTLHNKVANVSTPYRISFNEHGTNQRPLIVKGDMASDFITYRFFFGFSHFRNSQDFNVWPLFEKEFLPFCISSRFSAGEFENKWEDLQNENPNPYSYRGTAGSKAYRDFDQKLDSYSNHLKSVVEGISTEGQKFYNEHFAGDDIAPITLKLSLVESAKYSKQKGVVLPPKIIFGISKDGIEIHRPQSHLNEAKMTQLALSIRFAASLVNLHESDLKLLVIDDLLVSLDMSNRMKVVEILLSNTFASYQKVILTHELGLFQELRRHVGSRHHQWQFAKLAGNASDNPSLIIVKTDLEVAEDYLANDQLDECGNRLRKCAETILENFLRSVRGEEYYRQLVERGKFQNLAALISQAKSILASVAKDEFAALMQGQYSEEEFNAMVSAEGIDPNSVSAANNEEKGRIIGKLIAARPNLQASMLELLTDAARKQRNAVHVLNEVKRIKDRILNPASHAGVTPLYTGEAQDAIKIIQDLQTALQQALATL